LTNFFVFSCSDLGEPWVVRFDSLDRLGGCINVVEGEGKATITTIVGKCGTEYYKENGYVFLTNRLHIFRSIEDEVFDYNSYKLSCEYEGKFVNKMCMENFRNPFLGH